MVDQAIKLSHRVFCQTPEVAKVAQDLCIWFVQQHRVQTLSAKLIEQAYFSKYTYDVAMWQCSCAFCDAFFSDEVQNHLFSYCSESMGCATVIKAAEEEMNATITEPFTYLNLFAPA